MECTYVSELVVEENLSEETSVDEDENKIPSMYVKNVNKRLLSECYVKTKCLDEEVASKHLDELTAYEAILEEQRLLLLKLKYQLFFLHDSVSVPQE